MPCARARVASVFFLPSVMIFSASRCASLALGHVVEIVSRVKSDVTRLRSSACRCADDRFRCRYFIAPPAMMTVTAVLTVVTTAQYGAVRCGAVWCSTAGVSGGEVRCSDRRLKE